MGGRGKRLGKRGDWRLGKCEGWQLGNGEVGGGNVTGDFFPGENPDKDRSITVDYKLNHISWSMVSVVTMFFSNFIQDI